MNGRWRWAAARALDGLPVTCWIGLVRWARDGSEIGRIARGPDCRGECACPCGKYPWRRAAS